MDTKQEDNRINLKVVFVGLLVVLLGFGGGWLGARAQYNERRNNPVESQRVVLNDQGDLISHIAKNVGQSVVSVSVTSQQTVNYGLFYGSRDVEQQSAGTGIIISDDGLVMTNRHVVPAGTTNVSVTLSNGTELKNVEVVGRTNDTDTLDVAFLKIKDKQGQKLVAAKIGDSAKMRVGDSVVAIGNALGQFQNTVTSGIISGYGRSIQAQSDGGQTDNLDDLFQTDTAINQGNSGGPLVNMNGEVIGINTAIAGDNAQNIGFAIPIDNVSGLIESVMKTGELKRPYLGVVYVTVTDDIAKEKGLKANRGAYIPKSDEYGQATLVDDAPAAKAGVREGDIITKVDSRAIDETTSLSSALGSHVPGDTVKLTINRDGTTKVISVKLGTMPASSAN